MNNRTGKDVIGSLRGRAVIRATSLVGLKLVVTCFRPIALFISVSYILYIIVFAHIWGDQAYLIYAAREVLHGARLDGPRVVETNPPLIVWFSMIPVQLQHYFGLTCSLWLKLTTISLVAASTVWSCLLARRSRVRAEVGCAWEVCMAGLCACELLIRPLFVGQKEQLIVIFLIPYVIASALVVEMPAFEQCCLGISAGLGICLKPHLILAVIFLELFLIWSRRSVRFLVRPMLSAFVITGIGYVAIVKKLTPYLSDVLPLLIDTYWGFARYSVGQMLGIVAGRITVGILVLSIVWACFRDRSYMATLSGAFLSCSIGSLLAFAIQKTGWPYQAFPAEAFACLGAICMGSHLFLKEMPRPRRLGKLESTAVLLVACTATVGFSRAIQESRALKASPFDLDSELARTPRGTTVYVFSTEMGQFTTILENGLIWGGRYAHLWMMPAIIQNEHPDASQRATFKLLTASRLAYLSAVTRANVTQDLMGTQPTLIFVEQCSGPIVCKDFYAPVDFLSWFSVDPAFAEMWKQYTYLKRINGFDVYVRN